MIKSAATSLAVLLLATASAAAKCDSGETTIRFGAQVTNDFSQRQTALAQLKAAIAKDMQGKFCLQVLRDDTQFKGEKSLAALKDGRIELTAPAFSDLAKERVAYQVFALPFAFRNDSSVERFLASSRKIFDANLAQSGFVGLGQWHGFFSQISAKRPIYNPLDVGGMKIRFGDAGDHSTLLNALNATEQTIPENDLSIALKTGKVDAQISSWKQLNDDKTSGLLKGITQTNQSYEGFQIIASASWWNKLDTKLSKPLKELIERINRQINFETQRQNTNAKRAIMRSGVPIRILTQKQRKKWQTITKPLWDSFSSKELKALVLRSNQGL